MKTFVTQIELEELIKNHQPMLVIDVRSASEFESGHIPFALNMQLDEIQKNKISLASYTIIVTVCGKGGGRSAEAALWIREHYHIKSFYLEGGTFNWNMKT
jgi:rhodanese-related sulfurtransferase